MRNAMAAQVDALHRDALEPFRPWIRRELVSPASDDAKAVSSLRHITDVLKQTEQLPRLRTHSKPPQFPVSSAMPALLPPSPDPDAGQDLKTTSSSSSRRRRRSSNSTADHVQEEEPGHKETDPGCPDADTVMSTLRLTAPTSTPHFVFRAPDRTKPSRPSLKRRRSLHDVDGSNTSSMYCKKRRLRRYLITSRLSQPFSLPASHILNRESVASGDRRFLKLAAIMNARRMVQLPLPPPSPLSVQTSSAAVSPRSMTPTLVPVPHPPSPSEMLRRAAMANCIRKRAMEEAASGKRPVLMPAPFMTNARFVQMPAAVSMPAVTPSTAAAAFFAHVPRPAPLSRPPSRSAIPGPPAPPPPGVVPPTQLHTNGMAAFVRNSIPAGSTLPVLPPPIDSPRLGPVHDWSAVPDAPLEPSLPKEEAEEANEAEDVKSSGKLSYNHNDENDEGYAFPTSEHESRYGYDASDETDEVYSDFSVLFGGSGDEADFDDGYDDYMDELDGIAHLPRVD